MKITKRPITIKIEELKNGCNQTSVSTTLGEGGDEDEEVDESDDDGRDGNSGDGDANAQSDDGDADLEAALLASTTTAPSLHRFSM